jgi:CRISPR-associated protein Cmr2
MLRFALGPTQEFIEQSRTSRDLWISSFLLADFSWHAMQPFVERYGPDCIVYPDLRANPRADCWLFDSHQYALPENEKNPSTFAAVLPGVFVSLVPRGGQGHLETIESLANQAANNVNERWTSLAKVVQQWFQEHTCWNQLCAQIWTRQTRKPPICCTWTALPWRCMERINDPKNLTGRALPAQRKDFRQPAPGPAAENDRQAMESRRKRLSPWVPQKVWGHYELAREVFARSCLDLHQMERGFDYALTHHQLGARHALRKATDPAATVSEEPGEKCTLCGQREALRNEDNGDSRLDNVRALAREFWRNKELDPDQTGSERLCAVCAVKRFLVRADKTETNIGSFNQLWAGMSTPLENIVDHDGELRIPFPSTCAIAGQKFLKEVTKDHRLKPEIAAVIAACRQAKRPRTSFPRALPRLAVLHRDCGKEAQEFLEYEVQEVIFPETADGKAQALRAKNEDASKMDKLKEVKEAVSRLREKATELSIKPPNSQIAVIRVDGDNMGKLLLGSEDIIATRWKDVLHPKALVRLRENTHLRAAGWEDLLESKRLMGPSLHAFVSRTLGHFSHCIVPWVVEQEFSGRLIYSGGDNVLCLAPADEALDLAARLQQLFSAAWVVDTDPRNKQDQWAWRRKDWKGEYTQEKARKRLVIPLPGNQGTRPIELSNDGQLVATHTSEDDDSPRQQSVQGALLPMLGTSASLSAGIAIGHYKTPLSALLRRSKELQEFAKEPFKEDASKDASERNWKGRNALAIGHASRGGEKTRFALPWNNDSSKGCPTANLILREVVVGFKKGDLPNSLPYKLRELALSARCGLDCIGKDEKTSDQLLKGLFNSCLENSKGKFADAAFKVWKQGIYLQRSSTSKNPESKYTDGLLLCRALALGSDTCQGEE